jgi:hypothetical protein
MKHVLAALLLCLAAERAGAFFAPCPRSLANWMQPRAQGMPGVRGQVPTKLLLQRRRPRAECDVNMVAAADHKIYADDAVTGCDTDTYRTRWHDKALNEGMIESLMTRGYVVLDNVSELTCSFTSSSSSSSSSRPGLAQCLMPGPAAPQNRFRCGLHLVILTLIPSLPLQVFDKDEAKDLEAAMSYTMDGVKNPR